MLASLPLGLVLLPVLPGLFIVLAPAITENGLGRLFAEGQFLPAFKVTLISAVLSTALATLIAVLAAMALFPGAGWERLVRRLPVFLAVPHLAFAIGLAFLIAPSGWLMRLPALVLDWQAPPQIVTTRDPFGGSLALGLALKESLFLLWMMSVTLTRSDLGRHMLVARSLGYARSMIWAKIVLPVLLPRLGWPIAAVLAYGLSVVDMAIVLGPTNPPSLAVLATRMLSDPDLIEQAKGSAAALVLIVALGLLLLAGRAVWALLSASKALPDGRRGRPAGRGPALVAPFLAGLGWLVVAVLVVWSLSRGWFFPALLPAGLTLDHWLAVDPGPLGLSLVIGLASAALGLVISLIWLEWGPRRLDGAVILPLVLPLLPAAAGQYRALLDLGLEGSLAAVVWSHLFWVTPYMILALAGPYRAFDARMSVVAMSLGRSRLGLCLTVKWPILARPILLSLAVGFSVSVVQYLPTLFAGAGRFATVTMDAVASGAGESRQAAAVAALVQGLLPVAGFALATLLAARLGRFRRGMA